MFLLWLKWSNSVLVSANFIMDRVALNHTLMFLTFWQVTKVFKGKLQTDGKDSKYDIVSHAKQHRLQC